MPNRGLTFLPWSLTDDLARFALRSVRVLTGLSAGEAVGRGVCEGADETSRMLGA